MRIVVPIEMRDMKGGMLQSVELLLRYLPASIQKTVFLPRSSETGQRMRSAGAELVYSERDEWIVDRNRPRQTFDSVRVFQRELRRLTDNNTVVLTNNICSELLCGLGSANSGVARVFVNRGNDYRGVSRFALRQSLKQCRYCVATTEYQKETLMGSLGVDEGRIRIIPNGVDLHELGDAASTPLPSWYRPGRIHIATIGYPSPLKNQVLLIRALDILRRKHPNVTGVIAGSPGSEGDRIYLKFLKDVVEQTRMSDEIQFVPFVEDKRVLFAGVDILASTSTREGFGRTIVEAMAAGRPVVALRAGGPETIIQDGVNGLLVSNNTPEEFARRLDDIISDESFRVRLTKRATVDCHERYDASSVARAYALLFENCF